jgi:hypothetical protein
LEEEGMGRAMTLPVGTAIIIGRREKRRDRKDGRERT